MTAVLQTTREAWYRLLWLIVGLTILFYLLAALSILTDNQGLCIFYSMVYAIIILVVGFAPDTFGVLIVSSILWGLLPTTGAIANAITIVIKDFVRGVVYYAMVNSFMLLFLGTWNFQQNPKSALIIIAASIPLAFWGYLYKEGEWFKKVVLWYAVAVIGISLLATIFPEILPGKNEKELSRTEQLLKKNQEETLAGKQKELQDRIQSQNLTEDQLTESDRQIMEEARALSREGKSLSAIKEWGVTKPENRVWWYLAGGMLITITLIFKILRNSKMTAWTMVLTILLAFSIAILFQPSRDFLFELMRGSKILENVVGEEISRSVTVRSLEGVRICDIKPNTRYMFVRATTEYQNNTPKNNNKLFPKRNKRDGEITWSSIDGRFSMDGEKLPYKDPKYSFGILADGLPPGRLVTSDSTGCIRASFNSNLIPYYEVASPFGMAFVFREN